ncbi:SGNH/GDSL hydrolase family protein [bacterium]|nr:SGNH/GDSL hydrolase family protein [bacterium]
MIKKIAAVLFLCLMCAFVLEKLIALQSHTLASQNSWYSFKKISSSYFLGFMGSDEFLFERQSLAGQNLNLGTWFGYQDILYRKPLPDFKEYSVHFNLESEKSYLLIYLNCDQEKCWAFRASANSEYPTALLLVSNSGEYLRRVDLGSSSSIGTGGHIFTVRRQGQNYEIWLNDIPYSKFEYAFEYKPIRFMGGISPVNISAINFTDVADKTTALNFKTIFSIKIFLICLTIISVLSLVILIFFRKNIQVWNISYTALSVLLLVSLVFYVFDNYYWSHLYLTEKTNPTAKTGTKILNNLEQYRNKLFVSKSDLHGQHFFLHQNIWFQPFQKLQQKNLGIGINDFQIIDSNGHTIFKKDINSDIEKINQSNYLKVAFIGGSQAWGGGATSLNKTWAALIIKTLATKTNRKVVGINFSICGGVLYNFIERADLINKFKPDLFIASFGANDLPTPDLHFKFQLKEFSEKINLKQINTLLTIEAYSHEYSETETPKATFIRQFAVENELPLVSLHEYFQSPAVVDSGNMWHDQLHFTDFGHILSSRFFTNTTPYKKLLGNLNKSAGN